MSKRVQLIRHATAAANAFLGLQGEVTIDTTAKEARVHDGVSAGGIPTARKDLANVAGATTSIDGKLVAADKQKLDYLAVTQAVDVDTLESDAAGSKTKTDFITVTQAVDLDTMESNIATLDTDLNVAEAKLAGIETGATADQTNAEIKTAYEANANTNEFSDSEQTKLSGIESGATQDQTNAEIRAAVEAATDSNVFNNADHTKLNGIAASANNYSHPNHTGDVTSTGDGATVIASNAVDTAQIAAAAVGRSEIANSTTTQAGNFPTPPGGTNFSLNNWALFPMIHVPGSLFVMTGHTTDGGSAASPRFRLHDRNADGGDSYDVDHRWIIAA